MTTLTHVTARPDTDLTTGVGLDGTHQVILHNDDVHDASFVVLCLMRIFQHPRDLAHKIMLEAHTRGRAIAQVEDEDNANRHCRQLLDAGLHATVETV